MTKRVVKTTATKKSRKQARDYLTVAEVKRLAEAARNASNYPERDEAYIQISYRHALRVSEAAVLGWQDVDFDAGQNGTIRLSRRFGDSLQPLDKVGRRVLLALKKVRDDAIRAHLNAHPHILDGQPYMWDFIFCRDPDGFRISTRRLQAIAKRAGEVAGFPFPVRPSMLRHWCGYALALQDKSAVHIQQWMGYKNIRSTDRYFAK